LILIGSNLNSPIESPGPEVTFRSYQIQNAKARRREPAGLRSAPAA
jgi:hypothetical protein